MTFLMIAPAMIGTLLSLGLAWLTWREKPSTTWATSIVASLLAAVWCACQVPWVLSSTPSAIILSNQIQYAAIALLPVAWFRICLIETDASLHPIALRFLPFLLIVPAVTIYLAFTYSPESPNLLWREIIVNEGSIPKTRYGSWFSILVLHSYAIVLSGCLLLYGYFSQSPHYRKQMLVSCVIPISLISLNYLHVSGNWFVPLDPTPLGITLALVVWLRFTYFRDLFSLSPVARTIAVDRIADALFIIDKQGQIVDYNTSAEKLLANKDIMGQKLPDLLSNLPPLVEASDGEIFQAGPDVYLELNISTVQVSSEGSHSGHESELIVTLRDVTRQQVAQRLLLESRHALEDANEKLNRQANTDELTGLANRRFLLGRLDEEISRSRRVSLGLGVLFIDLDHFKQINDIYGHAVGDKVLKRVGELMLSHRKGIDIAARYGGEELVLVATNTDREGVLNIAQRLWHGVDNLLVTVPGFSPIRVTTSIGVAFLEDEDLNAYDLISRADQALYYAKSQGRNRVVSLEHGKFINQFEGKGLPHFFTS